jgi:hypothetical protein
MIKRLEILSALISLFSFFLSFFLSFRLGFGSDFLSLSPFSFERKRQRQRQQESDGAWCTNFLDDGVVSKVDSQKKISSRGRFLLFVMWPASGL